MTDLPESRRGADQILGAKKSSPIWIKSSLLQRAHTQWLFGDWGRLSEINPEDAEEESERALLAIFRAAGFFQLGKIVEGRNAVAIALKWGCERRFAVRVLTAGAFNSLGRARAISGHPARAFENFQASVTVGAPENDVELITQARITQQCWQIGLSSAKDAVIKNISVDSVNSSRKETEVQLRHDVVAADNEIFSSNAHAAYKEMAKANRTNEHLPFILMESKSIPRSGLHYLKKRFYALLGSNFSFCEYYQEPGCCKKMPCAYTVYVDGARLRKQPTLRLTKSHDFRMTDPVYPVYNTIRRVILVRNPLFVLTSWYALDSLAKYAAPLRGAGIDMRKVWYLHEQEVVDAACKVLDEVFVPPRSSDLEKWIDEKAGYIRQFVDKWVIPLAENPQMHQRLIKYEEIDFFVDEIANELMPRSSCDSKVRASSPATFESRNDPFVSSSSRVSEYLLKNSELFIEKAEEIMQYDWTRTLR